MSILSPPTHSPLLLNTKTNHGSPFRLLTFSSIPTNRHSSLILCSSTSKFIKFIATSDSHNKKLKLSVFHVDGYLVFCSITCRIGKWVGEWREKNLAWAVWLRCWCWWLLFSVTFKGLNFYVISYHISIRAFWVSCARF